MAEPQSYKNHAKYVPMFHFVLFGLIVISFILSLWNFYRHMHERIRLTAGLEIVITFCLLLLFFFTRIFAMKVQDRAIRAEENLRHFALTGKLLDRRLTIQQIVGLRFASDEEFPALAQKAAEQSMPLGEIKQSVKNWRADYDRA